MRILDFDINEKRGGKVGVLSQGAWRNQYEANYHFGDLGIFMTYFPDLGGKGNSQRAL